ncbi:MAG: chromosome segregation protein SMC [Chloroflexota bacterium]
MRLRQLQLQGYKTFAAQTDLAFEEGITAIVGPNGSGKSNIADAIRWVLGEQSYSLLRARRTEDMIFSGSERRARQGMARASLTLDNSSGWLPIEFSEVTIERRAFRSGENEYLLNGNRVRLRDITELLGQSGLGQRTYTFIGQGLVDRALSLGPAERRALFEEASGIATYQAKREEALHRLEQTQQNIVRVNDIINEIAPRLRHLERQAARAQEHQDISARLDELLRTWYGHRWQQGVQSLRQARAVSRHRQESLREVQTELDTLNQSMIRLRARQAELRAELSHWHRQSSDHHTRAEALQREVAVSRERARLLSIQHDELQAELPPLQIHRQEQAARVEAARTELAHLRQKVAEHQQAADDVRRRLNALQHQRQAHLASLTAARDRAFGQATELADRDNRRAQIEARRAQIVEEQHQQQQKLSRLRDALATAEAAQRNLQTQIEGLQGQLAALQDRRAERETRLAAAESERQTIQARLAALRQREAHLQERQAVLARMREEGEGFFGGVRSVLQAARQDSGSGLRGIVGALAGLIDVPAGLERAMEAALGSRLQNIVVERWDDAVAAIAHLKKSQAGEATFLPLDILRVGQPLQLGALANLSGIVGLASELVTFESHLRPAVELALGQTLVVEDMAAARRAFDRLSGGFRIVTRAGEVLRSDGAVTGGTRRAARDGSLLAREREWRDLPAQLAALNQQIADLDGHLAAIARQSLALTDQLSEMQQQADALAAQQMALNQALVEQDREASRLAQEIGWLEGLSSQLAAEAGDLQEHERRLLADREKLLQEQAHTQQQILSLERELQNLSIEHTLADLNRLQTALAVAQQASDSQQTILNSHLHTLARLDEQMQSRQSRSASLAQQVDRVSEQVAIATAQLQAISEELSAVQARIAPAEREIAGLDARRSELETQEDEQRLRLRQHETRYNQAMLEVTRREEEMAALKRQIEDDLGLIIEVEVDESPRSQPPLPLRPIVSTLPTVEELPEGLEEEMRHLRARLRQLGSVNPNAPQEYTEQLERRDFLVSQAQDLQQAAAHLREVIAELDGLMEKAFRATFETVAEAFTGYFSRLFGGGTARLVLTDPEKLMESGVEIIARPPGKRAQTLALLSGGERALTATALIFAFLKTNPPPFSILDEVDAMLDEANVGRFVELLQEQAQLNQFIVITHNRVTMKAANTLYGVTMGDDSVSRVYSKKLDDL